MIPSMTSMPHDALFKAAFEHPIHAAGLLRSVLPAAAAAAIDWATLERLPGSFVDPRLTDSHTDLLFRAKLLENAEYDFYIVVEHRSTPDWQLPRRMLGYGMDCWEECHKQQRREKVVGPLPIVLPVLISHAPGGWTTPTTMQALFAPPPEQLGLAPHVPQLRLLVEDLMLRSNEDLLALDLHPFPQVALWLLRDARTPERLFANLAVWLDAMDATMASPGGPEMFVQLMSYVANVCSDEHFLQFREMIRTRIKQAEETMITYAEKLIAQGIETGFEKGREAGREEGREEGRQEGLTQLLEKQLTLKFGEVLPAYRAKLEHATREQIDTYAARVLTADSLAAVFAE
jgi:hypothetical protein